MIVSFIVDLKLTKDDQVMAVNLLIKQDDALAQTSALMILSDGFNYDGYSYTSEDVSVVDETKENLSDEPNVLMAFKHFARSIEKPICERVKEIYESNPDSAFSTYLKYLASQDIDDNVINIPSEFRRDVLEPIFGLGFKPMEQIPLALENTMPDP